MKKVISFIGNKIYNRKVPDRGNGAHISSLLEEGTSVNLSKVLDIKTEHIHDLISIHEKEEVPGMENSEETVILSSLWEQESAQEITNRKEINKHLSSFL